MKRIRYLIILSTLIVSLLITTSAFASPGANNVPDHDKGFHFRWYSGFPEFKIVGVEKSNNVSIHIYNLPPADRFKVEMGPMGSRGIDGYVVGKFNSGRGGEKICTFDIPNALKGSYQIAIRIESITGSGYYAYNWFYNNSTGKWEGGGKPPKHVYSGIPTFRITDVTKNKSVTIKTYNLPPGDKFKVLMGPMGTKAKNGYFVDQISSGKGGKKSFTFDIPHQLYGSYKIAIRLQSTTGSGYFAYNWFYNNSTQ
jgi:hypothetical protein